MYNMPSYSYYQSPQSNETSQTYFLERTPSAKATLDRAMAICPPTPPQQQANANSPPTNPTANRQASEDQAENEDEGTYESMSDGDTSSDAYRHSRRADVATTKKPDDFVRKFEN